MNMGQKYWISDNADLNRAFPGNPEGQAVSRIADAVLSYTDGYAYGIQFASFLYGGTVYPSCKDDGDRKTE